jgi:hypothetical protein
MRDEVTAVYNELQALLANEEADHFDQTIYVRRSDVRRWCVALNYRSVTETDKIPIK